MKRCCLSELCKKEVICVSDGKKLGSPSDVEIDCRTGFVRALILPAGSIFSLLGGRDCIRVPWCEVERIGVDVIWVGGEYDKKDGYHGKDHKRDEDCCD